MKRILLFGLFVGLAGCGKSSMNYELDVNSFKQKDIKLVERKIGFSLPVGSRGLNMYYAGAQIDPSFLAKFEIPKNESERLVTQLEQMPSNVAAVTNYIVQRVTWWNPTPESTRIERRFFLPVNHEFVDILLCEKDGHITLYVDWASN